MSRLAFILALFTGLVQHVGADVTVTNGQTYLIDNTNTTLSGTTRTWNEAGTLSLNNGGSMDLQSTGRLDIGGFVPVTGFNFVGDIDEVRISNVVRHSQPPNPLHHSPHVSIQSATPGPE